MRVAPVGNVPVLKPFRGPVPLPASAVPGRAGDVAFPVVTSARRDAARITRLHGTVELPRPLSRCRAPGIGATGCPEHRNDQHREADDRDNHVTMIPVVVPTSSSCETPTSGAGDTLLTS